jgi:hypothetical protein
LKRTKAVAAGVKIVGMKLTVLCLFLILPVYLFGQSKDFANSRYAERGNLISITNLTGLSECTPASVMGKVGKVKVEGSTAITSISNAKSKKRDESEKSKDSADLKQNLKVEESTADNSTSSGKSKKEEKKKKKIKKSADSDPKVNVPLDRVKAPDRTAMFKQLVRKSVTVTVSGYRCNPNDPITAFSIDRIY